MRTKLLKRLRKEACSQFRIIYNKRERIYQVEMLSNYAGIVYNHSHWTSLIKTSDVDEAHIIYLDSVNKRISNLLYWYRIKYEDRDKTIIPFYPWNK